MRGWPLVLLVLACCSKPQPVTAVADEAKPTPKAPSLVGKRRFVLSTSHEISCSQSFETTGVYVTFDLGIDATGQATLKLAGAEHETFGPSESKFSTGAKVEHSSKPIAELWSGTARTVGKTIHVDLTQGGSVWNLTRELRRVDARRPRTEGADANATERVEVLACTPTRRVPERDAAHIGALLFAPVPGLRSSVEDYGLGGEEFELRLLRDGPV